MLIVKWFSRSAVHVGKRIHINYVNKSFIHGTYAFTNDKMYHYEFC